MSSYVHEQVSKWPGHVLGVMATAARGIPVDPHFADYPLKSPNYRLPR